MRAPRAWNRQTVRGMLRGGKPRFQNVFCVARSGKYVARPLEDFCLNPQESFHITLYFICIAVFFRYFRILAIPRLFLTATLLWAAIKLGNFQQAQLHIYRETVLGAFPMSVYENKKNYVDMFSTSPTSYISRNRSRRLSKKAARISVYENKKNYVDIKIL